MIVFSYICSVKSIDSRSLTARAHINTFKNTPQGHRKYENENVKASDNKAYRYPISRNDSLCHCIMRKAGHPEHSEQAGQICGGLGAVRHTQRPSTQANGKVLGNGIAQTASGDIRKIGMRIPPCQRRFGIAMHRWRSKIGT